jgi:hypothetical protein
MAQVWYCINQGVIPKERSDIGNHEVLTVGNLCYGEKAGSHSGMFTAHYLIPIINNRV